MDHNIFKDLVPSYIENLTSEETNRLMEKHMEQCEECLEYFKEMQEDLLIERANEQKDEKRSIDYLKKIRSKNRKKIFVITGSLLAFFLILTFGYHLLFVHMWIADDSNVQTSFQKQDNTVTLTFQSKKDNRYLLAMERQVSQGYTDLITIYENWNILADKKWNIHSNLAKSQQDGTDITYTFLDENTLLLDNGEEKKLTDDDKIIIQYKDRSEEIRLKDLYHIEKQN
jgi:hypothetical protein